MAFWFPATRQAVYLTRLSSPKLAAAAAAAAAAPPPLSLIHRRGFATGVDHHGPSKVNFWQDPLSPSRWKAEQFVIVSLVGWSALVYGGYKYFIEKDEKVTESPK
ncbi:uncharacterized protein LOC104891580 isoform X1 [Beta vulgaris subsp. vulgaris]|uniref:uncharacterized protein LOC104891580 isoform X1 n=1 Tax=Beta vulgaris subsp. vulgaris TaxID=3555 RepID=UPI0020367163|nr:uncharacterized protein LOC104891580 isoform X1 [Beta vulgaris subsp. vulgaris]